MQWLSFGRRGAARAQGVFGTSQYQPRLKPVAAPRPASFKVEPLEGRRLLSAVTGFTLINSQTDQPIRELRDGATLNLAELPAGKLNVRANTDNQGIASVRFRLDGANVNTEGSKPYALFGDVGSNYNDGTFSVGNHTLRATPFSRSAARGTAGTAKTINFRVVNNAPTPPPPALTRFVLIDADTDQPIGELSDGDEVNLAELPTRNINVKAEFAAGNVGSVRFGLDAASSFRVENAAPFALFSDAGGDYDPGTFTVGDHTLRARAFSRDNAQGSSGPQAQISFTVIDEPADGGQLLVFFANPADNDGLVNDELPATDDPATPEDDPGFVIAFVDQGGQDISDNDAFAFVNAGPGTLTLSGPLEVGINRLGLSGTDRTILIDESGGAEDGTVEIGDISFQIDDDRNIAFRSVIVRFVKPDPNEPSNSDPDADLPVRDYTFLQADAGAVTPPPADFTSALVLTDPAADAALSRVDFTLEQGDTPFQGGGGGRPAPGNRAVRPRGRR